MDELSAFDRIRRVILSIPPGEVMGYGEVGEAAGFPRAARTVTWVLKSTSASVNLPWHRVVNKDRRIAIRNPEGYRLQKALLEAEGWTVGPDGRLTKS